MEPWRRFIELENFLEEFTFNQDKYNINKGSFPDVCPKHCHCYKYQEFRSFYAKVKCFKRGLNQLPDWEIDPRVIDFSNNSIKRIPEGKFSKFNNLSMLLLNNNQIKNLREHTFDGLFNLKHLSLKHNKIRKIEDYSFNELKKLRTLSIGYNEIKEIKRHTFYLLDNLEHLYLEHNQIKRIEKFSFNGLNKLKLLSLHNNEIEKIEPLSSDGLNYLTFLSLYNNSIRSLDEHSFDGLRRLQNLYLMDNKISYIHKRAFKHLHSLEGLFLSNNEISFISPTTFHSLWSLELLHLTNNNITTISYRWFSKFNTLHDLWLDENPVVCDCSFFLNINESGKRNPNLKTVKEFKTPECFTKERYDNLTDCKVSPEIGIEPRDSEVSVGKKIRLNCEAIGIPEPNITWSFNGEPLQLDNRKQISSSGTLQIKNILNNDEGKYQCNATNTEGTVLSKQITLTIKEKEVLNGSTDE